MKPAVSAEIPTLLGRVTGALMAFAFFILTTFAVPILFAWKFPLRHRALLSPLDGWSLRFFLLWVVLVALFALIIGFVHGAWGTLEMFNLVWRTGDSWDQDMIDSAAQIRKLILITVCVPLVFMIFSRL